MNPSNDALPGSPAEELERQKQALRIQAAAVAAQQAALTEEERRLQHCREALQRQEQQLATHLEEKRQRLLNLRDEARQARKALEQTRSSYEQRVAQIMRELGQSRRELVDGQTQIQEDRQRLVQLRQRLKRRFHRHWASERMQMQLREGELDAARRGLEAERARLRQGQTDLNDARLRFNAEMELGRRSAQAEGQELRQREAKVQEREQALDQRQAILEKRAQELATEKQRGEEILTQLRQEAEGLENRIASSRRKLLDQEQERKRLDGATPALASQKTSASGPPWVPAPLPSAALLPFGSQWLQREGRLDWMEAELTSRMNLLHLVAGELADQRLYLAEQVERLGLVQQHWQTERDSVAADLESLGQRLRTWEETLHQREQTLAATEQETRRRWAEVGQMYRQYETAKAGLVVREAAWKGEQDRLLAHLRAQQQLVEQRSAALSDLRERWDNRRQRQVYRLRERRRADEALYRQAAAARQEWLDRSAALAKEQRALAERALALEQFRQQCIARAANPKAAEKRLERLRRRWAALAAATQRKQARERISLENQSARLEQWARHLKQETADLLGQETDLAARQAAWEEQQLQIRANQDAQRFELGAMQRQRHVYEEQLQTVQEQVEHLVLLLLNGNDPTPAAIPQAA